MINISGIRYIACLALVGGLVLGEVSTAEADTGTLASCQRALYAIEEEESDFLNRLKRMQSLGEKCSGTGLYEYHLAKLYINTREYEKSARVFDDGLELGTEFSNLLLLGKGDIYLHQHDYPRAEQIYREVTDKFPEWYAGFNFLGFALLAQDKNSEAIESLVRSNALAEAAETYKHLTVAYHRTGQHEQAVDAFGRAYSLDEAVLEDTATAADCIKSYAMIGKFEIAKNVLALMLKANSDVRQDPKFLEAGFFLKEKMQEAGLLQ